MVARTAQPTPNRRPPAKLSTLFNANIRLDDSPAAEWWPKHCNGDADATAWLFEFYAPLCNVCANRWMRRNTDPTTTYDDVISDASLGLLNALRFTDGRTAGFSAFAMIEIRKTIHRHSQMRRWGGRRGSERASVIRHERGKLTAELGRMPQPEELAERLRGVITNPNIVIDGEKQIYARSQLEREDRRPMEAGKIDPPDRNAIDADMMRLAKKGMSRQDFKILQLLLQGHSALEIGRRLQLRASTANDRCTGVIWLCKCNAKLAAYLGTEAATMPPRVNGRLPRLSLRDFRLAVSENVKCA